MKKLADEIASIEKQITEYVPTPPLADAHWRAYELYKLHEDLKATPNDELRAVRLKLQSALQPLIERIDLLTPLRKQDNNEYATGRIAELNGLKEGELIVERPPTFYRDVVVHGPIAKMMLEGEFGDGFEKSADGGWVVAYSVPERGMLNSVREAEYRRQLDAIPMPPPPPIIERTPEEEARVQAAMKERAIRPSRRREKVRQ